MVMVTRQNDFYVMTSIFVCFLKQKTILKQGTTLKASGKFNKCHR